MKRNSRPTPLGSVMIQSDSSISIVLQHIELIKSLQTIVSQNLDPELSEHCKVINLRTETLVIRTKHANWATRLRYATPNLLHAIRADSKLPNITTVRIVTIPDKEFSQAHIKNRLMMSDKTSAELRNIAESMTDPDISACLNKLSKHTKPRSSPKKTYK